MIAEWGGEDIPAKLGRSSPLAEIQDYEMQISVEVYQDDQVFIHVDEEGLSVLRDTLDALASADEVSLLSPTWDGQELIELPMSPDRSTVHHVKLCRLRSA